MRGVEKMGFTKPTPIQEKTIGPLLRGRDVIGQAKTGSGKTARLLGAAAALDRPEEPPGPGARPGADAGACGPDNAGDEEARRPHRRQGGHDLRRPVDRSAAARAEARGPGRRRHDGQGHRPHQARVARPPLGPVRGPRRGGHHARHGLHRRRRLHPGLHPGEEAGVHLLRHDAPEDNGALEEVHGRPGEDPRGLGRALRRDARPVLRGGQARREARSSSPTSSRRSARPAR